MPSFQAYLKSGQRKVEPWLEQQTLVKVDFSDEVEVFTNINSMAELMNLEKM